jgi:hypothetical protein
MELYLYLCVHGDPRRMDRRKWHPIKWQSHHLSVIYRKL